MSLNYMMKMTTIVNEKLIPCFLSSRFLFSAAMDSSFRTRFDFASSAVRPEVFVGRCRVQLPSGRCPRSVLSDRQQQQQQRQRRPQANQRTRQLATAKLLPSVAPLVVIATVMRSLLDSHTRRRGSSSSKRGRCCLRRLMLHR